MRRARFAGRTAALVLVALVAGLLLAWTISTGAGQGQQNSPAVNSAAQAAAAGAEEATDAQAVEQAKSLSRAFRAAARQVLPTVVEVRTKIKPPQRGAVPDRENPFKGTPFEDFFGDDLPGFPFYGIPQLPTPGLGSGVIIDPAGIVLTNNHVVADAEEVTVQLGDGRVLGVKEIKTDERTDLALLRLDTTETLPAARLGDSDQLEIGDWVLAIGNPFALEQTVSAGIISGKGRSLNQVRRARFLQTDAAINPGNSGGPLVNLSGEVVGINTAIFSGTGGNQGIGFAIPINLAKWVAPQLIKQGRVARAYLGISMLDLNVQLAEKLKVSANAGVVVDGVGQGSPAEAAGLRAKDVIVAFDGQKVANTADLQELVERSQAESSHEIQVLRDGQPQTLRVVLKAMPEDFEEAMFASGQRGGRLGSSEFYNDRQLGVVVMDLTEEMAARLSLEGVSGALIFHVDADRIGAQAGLRPGMLITRVGDKPVGNVAEYEQAIQKESLQQGIALEVQTRRGKQVIHLKSS